MLSSKQQQQQQQEESSHGRDDATSGMGLAARRMARMMGSMKFSVTPYAAETLFRSQGEINRHLHGGSAGSHLAMASDTGDTLDRIRRARYSKLYFAPKVLTDQMYNTDDSASDGDGDGQRRRRLGLMVEQDMLEQPTRSPGASSRSASPRSPPRQEGRGAGGHVDIDDDDLDGVGPPPTIHDPMHVVGKLGAAAYRARSQTKDRPSAAAVAPITPPLEDPLDAVGPPPIVGGGMVLASVGKLSVAASKARVNANHSKAEANEAATPMPGPALRGQSPSARRTSLPPQGAVSSSTSEDRMHTTQQPQAAAAAASTGSRAAGGSGRSTPVGSGKEQQQRSSIAAASSNRAKVARLEEQTVDAVDLDDL